MYRITVAAYMKRYVYMSASTNDSSTSWRCRINRDIRSEDCTRCRIPGSGRLDTKSLTGSAAGVNHNNHVFRYRILYFRQRSSYEFLELHRDFSIVPAGTQSSGQSCSRCGSLARNESKRNRRRVVLTFRAVRKGYM
ncbi:hypothetical protein AG1IA_10149 [Rhizoctonia solani AG-1 IA]|uniref:Uncharacterized protein n=1 Tax=Thanatephorus cucumeris (strain AG1-IA) TaxID=983506 RepID=L8WCD9_THACA|nr:hypothetical protein AG1IA_10149 [Rhizoctonia solani AG-1 IA]